MKLENSNQVRAFLQEAISRVIEEVAKELLEKLKEQIMKDVYTSTNSWYYAGTGQPTYEFLNAWDWDEIKRTGLKTITTLYMHPEKMRFDRANWSHGSPIAGDSRESMDDILNLAWNGYKPGYTSGLQRYGRSGGGFLSHRRRPYWENFIKKHVDSGKLDKLIERKLKRLFPGMIKVSGRIS